MKDARFEKSAEAIKQAFLRLLVARRLEDISMSELAREAQVSRSTLYAHFGNVEEVYHALVMEFLAKLRSLNTHLHCSDCVDAGDAPVLRRPARGPDLMSRWCAMPASCR